MAAAGKPAFLSYSQPGAHLPPPLSHAAPPPPTANPPSTSPPRSPTVLDCTVLCVPQAHRAVLPQLPCQVAACVSLDELASVPWAVREDARRSAKFMTFALTAAAEVRS